MSLWTWLAICIVALLVFGDRVTRKSDPQEQRWLGVMWVVILAVVIILMRRMS